jgi:glycosyltransferase involved in cell wall biosynthesis
MRFLYHHRTAGRGGEGVHIASVVRALERQGHVVRVVSPPGVDPLANAGGVPLDKGSGRVRGLTRLWRLLSVRAPQWMFELAEIAYNVAGGWAVRKAAAAFQPDVYYERYAFYCLAGVVAARRAGCPVLLEVNEVAGVERARRQTLVSLCRWLERHTFSRSDEIFVVSSFLQKEVLARGGRAGHVHVVPNAIDPARFEQAGDGAVVRSRHGLDGAFVIGFVGWFDRWDRLDLLLEVLQRLRSAHPHVRLLLVGDGPAAADLRARVREEGLESQVILTGSVPATEVPTHIAAMDTCILPDSNTFGSPIVLFEFMALGKAVIGPDLLPITDVLTDGVNGLVVPRGDVAATTRAVERLITDPGLRQRLGAAARRQVGERHTWDATAALIARHGRNRHDATLRMAAANV